MNYSFSPPPAYSLWGKQLHASSELGHGVARVEWLEQCMVGGHCTTQPSPFCVHVALSSFPSAFSCPHHFHWFNHHLGFCGNPISRFDILHVWPPTVCYLLAVICEDEVRQINLWRRLLLQDCSRKTKQTAGYENPNYHQQILQVCCKCPLTLRLL